MPQVKLQKMGKESAWALWFITENEAELAYEAMESCPEEVISIRKRLEYLAGRALLKTLVEHTGKTYSGVRKNDEGKPFLKDHPHQISLSHSFPYVAAQIHPSASVGIDLEQPKEKLLRIASRVLSKNEKLDAGDNIIKHCVYWCAKEAMYKIYGKRGLHFSNQLNIEPFALRNFGELSGKITTGESSKLVSLSYSIQPDYVLVYTQTLM